MTHIIDYQATQPISKTGETTFAIPASPNKAILANLKVRISSRDSRNNRGRINRYNWCRRYIWDFTSFIPNFP